MSDSETVTQSDASPGVILDKLARQVYEYGGCPSCGSTPWDSLGEADKEFWRELIRMLDSMAGSRS
jgi:hypothetical protein